MITDIKTYFKSLSDDIVSLNISNKNVTSLPDLTRFKNLKILHCSNNKLTLLPTLPQNLEELNCYDNELTLLPTLPQKLKILRCFNNKLTLLPSLPQKLQRLYCDNNELTWLPTLPQNLIAVDCSDNKLTCLPTLPQNLEALYCYNNKLTLLPSLPRNLERLVCYNNPIYEILQGNSLFQIKQNIKILNKFRHLYYCLKFKKQLRKWLWEKVREPKIKKIYSPNYLLENLGDEDDLNEFLNNWIQ